MRVVIQRVSRASVRVEERQVGCIGTGILALVGFGPEDEATTLEWVAEKIWGLRIFPDGEGRMNRSLLEVGGALLVVSQFTLYGDATRGRRPSFTGAAAPEAAEALYEAFLVACRARGPVESGDFGALMEVELVNDGPVTLLLER